jgi:CRP-like cAMP-binding protein
MSSCENSRLFTANRLLDCLSRAEYERLRPLLEPVRLRPGKVLYEVGDSVRYAYFLTSGMVSLLAATTDDDTVQIAMVGNEGLIGIPALLRNPVMPYRSLAQLPTTALRISAPTLSAQFERSSELQGVLLRYLHTLITQITQSALCNRYHTIEARLCRWLLISHDRMHSDMLPLTQEALAHMLGSQRTGVTAAAGVLQHAGLISYRRGKIRLLKRRELEAAACECYRIVSEQLAQFQVA